MRISCDIVLKNKEEIKYTAIVEKPQDFKERIKRFEEGKGIRDIKNLRRERV